MCEQFAAFYSVADTKILNHSNKCCPLFPDTEFETMDEVFSQPQDSLPQPKQESSPEEAEHTEERRGPHPQEDACHKIFERFSTSEMVNCMSPLPPSPQPSLQDEVQALVS